MADLDVDGRYAGFYDTTLIAAPKRIIICCDGTWQSSVTTTTNVPSNVTRLARHLTKAGRDKNGQIWPQLVYYDAGIGTGVSGLEAKRQGGTGSGFVGNVIEAYNFIVLNYNPGDQIFCFGFSRGAYTARAVAGLVTDIGVIQPRDMQDFPELYRLYQAHDDSHTFRTSEAWRIWVEGKRRLDPNLKNLPAELKRAATTWEQRPHGAAPESTRWIEAIGVFDTVGSLGIPEIPGIYGLVANVFGRVVPVEDFGFHNVALSPYVKHAYHAMALDEHRKPFNTTLWHFPADGVAVTPTPSASSSQFREEWKKLRDDDDATKSQLATAWENLINAEMYEEIGDHKSTLLQVWFPGVHINIGGGSDDLLKDKKSDFEQIAMITFTWMVEQLTPHLSFEINITNLSQADRFLLMRPVVEDLIKSKNKTHWLMKKINADLAKDSKADPWNDGNKTRSRNLAASALKGWATAPIIDSFEGEMAKAGSHYRTPGEYTETKLQSGKTVKLGKTNEQIHPTVKYRMEQLGSEYNPIPLKSFVRQKKTGGGFEWVKGGVRIPEYKIGGYQSLERYCLADQSARDFLGRVDEVNGIQSFEASGLHETPAKPENHGFQGFQPSNGF